LQGINFQAFGMEGDEEHPGCKNLNEVTAIGFIFVAIKELKK